MTFFAIALSALLLSGLCRTTSAKELEQPHVANELEVPASIGRVLEQKASGSVVSQEDEPEEIDCSEVLVGASLSIVDGRVIRSLNTSTVGSCCKACQAMETCTSWRRSRSNGTCDLISASRAVFDVYPQSEFDIGGYTGLQILLLRIDPNVIPAACRINQGRAYPNGNVLTEGRAPSSDHCCRICRASRDCNSWHLNNRNNRCTLNRNIPQPRPSPGFSGGII